MDLIQQCTDETDKTVLLVTHEAYIAHYARRTVKIKDGLLFE